MDKGVAFFFFNTRVLCFCYNKIVYLIICVSQKLKIEWEQLSFCCIHFRTWKMENMSWCK